MNQTPVALLGLGIMGTGMARRLLAAGYPLTVWNRNSGKGQLLAKDGATVATTPREAATRASIVVSMVADDAASRAVWIGEGGALAGATPGATLIECSTLSVGWVHEVSALAKEKRCTFIDAPVTGSKSQAAAGELNFLVGADGEIPELAVNVLQAMGKSITRIGPVGSGAMIKLINNFVCGVQLVAIAEAIALIQRTDLDREKAVGLLTNGTPGSPMVKNVVPRMTARDYTPSFLMRLMAKDLTYAIAEAKHRSLDLSSAATALQSLTRAIPAHGEQDMSAIVEMYRSM